MIRRVAALILLTAVSLIQTADVPQILLDVVEVGGNVTLRCPIQESEDKFIYWYKQPLGYMFQKVSGGYNKHELSEQFSSTRFSVTKEAFQYLLTIRNVTKEDEAAYFCQTGTAYSMRFVTGNFLAVNGHSEQNSVYVKQSPEKVSVQQGEWMNLQCSLLSKSKENTHQCPGEHRVHWFRDGLEGFHPSFIYTQSNDNDEQEERSCVYRFSETIQNPSDAGTYYCAVDTCGKILFGGGTKVETRPKLDPVVLILGVLLACSVTVICILIFYLKRVSEHCKGEKNTFHQPDKSTLDQSNYMDGDAEAVNYAALDFSSRKASGVRKKKESPQECVYSAVRADCHTPHQIVL